jgi:putative transposase
MCKCLEVARSSYYEWRSTPLSRRSKENKAISDKIRIAFNASRKTYGARRIKKVLAKEGWDVSRCRIGRLMRVLGLICKTKRKFKITTDS